MKKLKIENVSVPMTALPSRCPGPRSLLVHISVCVAPHWHAMLLVYLAFLWILRGPPSEALGVLLTCLGALGLLGEGTSI